MISVTCSTTTWELPPRARRIRTTTLVRRVTRGTISACAENTPPGCSSGSGVRNYLRVRGEYNAVRVVAMTRAELPPRARRILLEQSGDLQIQGTTSACAENTARILADSWPVRNYLRVRGEYTPSTPTPQANEELPPRARRIRVIIAITIVFHGTTSACAENTIL